MDIHIRVPAARDAERVHRNRFRTTIRLPHGDGLEIELAGGVDHLGPAQVADTRHQFSAFAAVDHGNDVDAPGLQVDGRAQAVVVVGEDGDPLTGLYNRRYMEDMMERFVNISERSQRPLSVVMIDLDHFKRVNDEHGHAVGDQVLADVGRLLSESVRVIDVAGRYGGEELCVLLPNTPLDGALKFAETLRVKIATQAHHGAARALSVTASLGVGSFDHLKIADAESLLRQADDALYRAKHAGRNRVEGGASIAAH